MATHYRILILAAAYFASGYVGLEFPYFESTVTLIWPPTGITLAALLCWGWRIWPGAAIGALAVNLTTGVPLETVALITIGNTLSGVVGSALLTRFSTGAALAGPRSLVLFIVLGVAASPLVSSLNGAAAICLTLLGGWTAFYDIWWGWWVGDLMGILLFAPLVLQLARRPWRGRPPSWYAELALIGLGAVAVSILVHSAEALARQEFLFVFVSLPFALWGVVRFGLLGAAITNLSVCLTSIAFLTSGNSFFIVGDVQESLLRFYGFFGLVGCVNLLFAGFAETALLHGSAEPEGGQMRKVKRVRTALAIGCGVLGLAISVAAAILAPAQIERAERLTNRYYALAYEANLRAQLDVAGSALLAVRTMFEVEGEVSRDRFSATAKPWLQRSPALLALEWIPAVAGEERAALLDRARRDGLREFDIRELRDGRLVPAPQRDRYFPVYYVAPLHGNTAALGLDLYSDPVRHAAIAAAIASDSVAASEAVELVQGTKGLLMAMPVHRAIGRGLAGIALGVIDLPALVGRAYREAGLPDSVAAHVIDHGAAGDARLLYSTEPESALERYGTGARLDEPADGFGRPFPIAGRDWTVILGRDSAVSGLSRTWQPLGILMVGAILSGALSLYLLSLTRSEERITRLVMERSRMLQQARLDAEAAMEQAQEANRAKSEFLAHMSHELRSPLNAMLGYAELALNDPESRGLSRQAQSFIRTIVDSGRHLVGVIGDILDLSKIESGNLQLERVPFDLRRMMVDVISIMAPEAEKNGNSLLFDMETSLHSAVLGDPVRVRQVVLNFLSNAVKFARNGTVGLKVECLDETPERIRFRIAVSDSGIGIPPARLADLFEAFTQGDMSTTREYGGTGLGLAINKRLVDAMDGEIGVESREGEGSTFRVDIGFDKTTDEAIIGMSANTDAVVPSLKLLLVEDVEINRYMAERLLENAGHRVVSVANGREAVEAVQGDTFDAVLMDVQMPGMDGVEATRLIRQLPDPGKRRVPIVALTANIADQDLVRYREAGMDHHCAKPMNSGVLSGILKEIADRRPASGPPAET